MDVFNQVIKVVSDALPIVQSVIPSIVGAFITAMFLRGNTQRVEFEKIKMGKVQEAIDDLVKSRELTLTELVKCKNLLRIAELADREYKNKESKHETGTEHEFDFDWFLRFFEGAGNISNEDMQLFWARILAGEVQKKGTFSLRTLETLRNMTQYEAKLFQEIARFFLMSHDGTWFMYHRYDYNPLDEYNDNINELYGIENNKLAVLEECGILRPYKHETYMSIENDGSSSIYNANIFIMFEPKVNYKKEEYLLYNNFEITQTGMELISIVDVEPDDNYILDLGLLFKERFTNLTVKAFRIEKIEHDNLVLDSNNNLLENRTRSTHSR